MRRSEEIQENLDTQRSIIQESRSPGYQGWYHSGMEDPWIPSAVSFRKSKRTSRSIHVEESIETVSENAKEIGIW